MITDRLTLVPHCCKAGCFTSFLPLQILQVKIRRLEHLLKLKDMRISDMEAQTIASQHGDDLMSGHRLAELRQ